MILLAIYSVNLIIVLYMFISTKDRWQKLISLASFSTKISLILLLFAYMKTDSNLFDVFFFYTLLNASGIIFLSYFLSKEDLG
ncbi:MULTISPECIES: hypothetical protein [Pseudothermotoga]|uniref:Multiple resistance and pH regulation protein F n=1 Tax=Pseudothermotoga lettingae (strain ATCC BAA-301 / DSM 14385 / NBRC 107922 / TMO) TaxID=416591 RepID=A8F8X3_PSELT|nr:MULTISPECIES: hypothetical protein [Pseudothermotoga]ABV34607.1 hypothetical protein Tlet_2053 [Pseudothermotoga lettingae TMO]KUK21294.1 MAG: Uncharacterized protein XD56_0802 [Pseudothermotoga lettingae]MDI3494797.1 multicomponent Na+:H+ antiporter subunit [Pseudothermotoga sp.]MDK2883447.1 multicomponent Na+:H+ antiporter subunit [Pseudothermotoga sp.]GLI48447.1 hypothetical protein PLETTINGATMO_06160 [Pseudothermotoga lettingae TMO]